MRLVAAIVLVACGSSPQPPPPTTPVSVAKSTAPTVDDGAERERARRAELAAAHHKLEEEQSVALAASCPQTDPKPAPQPRCLPSCYATEAPDPRAAKKQQGAVEIQHLVCERGRGEGVYGFVDELDGTLAIRPARRFPKPHKKGWQADLVKALAVRDLVVITGTWRERMHPLTKESMRCVTASRYVRRVPPRGLDACAGAGTCEAAGSAVARAINVVHYRLAEARRLQAAGKQDDCQQAALEAVAVARGLPRWRQYMKLNVAKWTDGQRYRTRFDGLLDEESLFTAIGRLGTDAEGVYVACGGGAGAPTAVAQEQSFHTCW